MLGKISSGLIAIFLLVLIAAGNLQAQQEIRSGRQITWQITAARVLDPGRTTTGPQGTTTDGYQIEAEATAVGASPIPKGIFRLTLSIFSPGRNLPGQKAGLWYLRGNWSLADIKLPPEAAKARYSQGMIKGVLTGELPFNPALTPGKVQARVRLPMSPQAGGWGKGEGTFKGDEKFVGQLDLTWGRWQRTRKSEGGKP